VSVRIDIEDNISCDACTRFERLAAVYEFVDGHNYHVASLCAACLRAALAKLEGA
jgi:MinD superfamily P-loop ATPase